MVAIHMLAQGLAQRVLPKGGSAVVPCAPMGAALPRSASAHPPLRLRLSSMRLSRQVGTAAGAGLNIQTYPEKYAEQLQEKVDTVRDIFKKKGIDLPDVEVFESAREHFRLRAEFRVWHEEGDMFYAMFDPAHPRKPVRVDEFRMASERVNELMVSIREEVLKEPDILKRKLFQANFLTTMNGDDLVSLVYHKKLNAEWEAKIQPVCERLNVAVVGRSHGQKVPMDRDFVTEVLPMADGRHLSYKQMEGAFSQPNGGVSMHMLHWALDVSKPSTTPPTDDLLELYCGNGNFTIALSPNFRKCLATEISKSSVRAALENCEANAVTDSINIVRMSSEEFSESLLNGVERFRLREVDLASHDFRTLLVDPPRSGLDADSLTFASRFDHIIYISCNPETLAENLESLSETHRVERFAVFDQFPYTPHVEGGAYLVKK